MSTMIITKCLDRVLKSLNTKITLSLFVVVLFGMAVWVAQAASESPKSPLLERASIQGMSVDSYLMSNPQKSISAYGYM